MQTKFKNFVCAFRPRSLKPRFEHHQNFFHANLPQIFVIITRIITILVVPIHFSLIPKQRVSTFLSLLCSTSGSYNISITAIVILRLCHLSLVDLVIAFLRPSPCDGGVSGQVSFNCRSVDSQLRYCLYRVYRVLFV